MKTIALRFSNNYAPKEGMIYHHQKYIDKNGYVWYGKFGNSISEKVIKELLENKNSRFLLIKSGGVERYWAYIDKIQKEVPELKDIPEYYRNDANKIKCWFRIIKIEKAENNIISKCFVSSTKTILSNSSKYSMSPYFIIDCESEERQ